MLKEAEAEPVDIVTVAAAPQELAVFSTEELTMKAGFFKKLHGLAVTMRFTDGESLDTHWPRLLGAIQDWRKKRGKRVDMLNVIFQCEPEAHPELSRAFTDRVEADAELNEWIGDLRDYTLRFQEMDGTGGRDLIRERQPNGQYMLSEMKFTEMK